MKASLIATVLIVVATAVLAWIQNERIKTVRNDHAVLVERAAVLGLTADGTPAGKSGVQRGANHAGGGQRSGGSSKDEARDSARELFAFAAKMKIDPSSNQNPIWICSRSIS